MTDIPALIMRAQAKDPGALDELLQRYHDPLAGLIRRRLSLQLRRRYDTEDLLQSVFAEVIADLPRFEYRGEPQFRHWLYIKAESKVWAKFRRDLGRNRRRWQPGVETSHDQVDEAPSPLHDASRLEEMHRLETCMRRLNDSQRRVLQLRYEEGRNFAEIAEELGLPSADAARKRFARGLAKLQSVAAPGV